jgi:hypothetical protein
MPTIRRTDDAGSLWPTERRAVAIRRTGKAPAKDSTIGSVAGRRQTDPAFTGTGIASYFPYNAAAEAIGLPGLTGALIVWLTCLLVFLALTDPRAALLAARAAVADVDATKVVADDLLFPLALLAPLPLLPGGDQTGEGEGGQAAHRRSA